MNKLRELRTKRGLTLNEMSKELKERLGFDITPDALSKYERGERKMNNLEAVKNIACFFCVSIDYLLGNVSNMCREEQAEPEEVKQLTDWYDFKYCPYCGRKL